MNTKSMICSRKGCEQAQAKSNYLCYEHKREAARAWWASNRARGNELALRYRQNHQGHTFEDGSGYVKYIGFNHPACSPSGMTRYHRIVLWDKLNGQDVPCTDCGRQLYWDKTQISNPNDALVVDHINGIRNDNRPENLDPVCGDCNNKRAAKMRKGADAA